MLCRCLLKLQDFRAPMPWILWGSSQGHSEHKLDIVALRVCRRWARFRSSQYPKQINQSAEPQILHPEALPLLNNVKDFRGFGYLSCSLCFRELERETMTCFFLQPSPKPEPYPQFKRNLSLRNFKTKLQDLQSRTSSLR